MAKDGSASTKKCTCDKGKVYDTVGINPEGFLKQIFRCAEKCGRRFFLEETGFLPANTRQ